ncbi:MAG: DNA integrity scanning protein DisA nucleotide-binding domain protein [Deltaproteobacteria bacterium]|nr:DNA integrity scanning protein DisA nucleotide-binding domain protein [Deltaproteobacteria bacterium]
MTLAETFSEALVRAARSPACERVLVVGASSEVARRLRGFRAKTLFALHDAKQARALEAAGFAVLAVPDVKGSRTDRLKSAVVAATNAGLIAVDERVACAIVRDDGELDMLMHFTAREVAAEHASLHVGRLTTRIDASLLEVLVDLALRIGREGYEGRPVGTLIVVGDSTKVMEQSAPLTMNPFQGYSEQERNLFDPEVRSAVRTFAMLDGAFVVREDGVVLAAGRHVRVAAEPTELHLGYGARHVAAAAVTLQSEAIAIAVSQSSGKVRLFDKGHLILELEPGGRRAAPPAPEPLPKPRRARRRVTSDTST